MTSDAIQQVWLLSLAIGVVALVGLSALLAAILFTTRKIRAALSAIWDSGQRVTNNAVYLSLLRDTTFLAGALLEPAGQIALATERIAAHVDGCQGCPACLAGRVMGDRT